MDARAILTKTRLGDNMKPAIIAKFESLNCKMIHFRRSQFNQLPHSTTNPVTEVSVVTEWPYLLEQVRR